MAGFAKTSADRTTSTTRCSSTPSSSRSLRQVSPVLFVRSPHVRLVHAPPPSPPALLLNFFLLLFLHLLLCLLTLLALPPLHPMLALPPLPLLVQSPVSYCLLPFRTCSSRRRAGAMRAGSAGTATATCSLICNCSSGGNSTGHRQRQHASASVEWGATARRRQQLRATGQRNAAAPHCTRAAQRLDLRSINSCEAQPVAGSLRLFLAASHPIRY